MEKKIVLVEDLSGPALDWALMGALGLRPVIRSRYRFNPNGNVPETETFVYTEPSKDEERMMRHFFMRDFNIVGSPQTTWVCSVAREHTCGITSSTNKLEAIARLIVLEEIGAEVEIPIQLVSI